MLGNTYDLFRDFVDLRDTVDRIFQGTFGPGDRLLPMRDGWRTFPLEVYETPDDIVVRALVPGVAPENLDVQYQQGTLTLRARMPVPESHDDWTWHIQEFAYGEAARRILLPKDIDADSISSTFENGVLTLTLPKVAEARPKQIKVGGQQQITAGSTDA